MARDRDGYEHYCADCGCELTEYAIAMDYPTCAECFEWTEGEPLKLFDDEQDEPAGE